MRAPSPRYCVEGRQRLVRLWAYPELPGRAAATNGSAARARTAAPWAGLHWAFWWKPAPHLRRTGALVSDQNVAPCAGPRPVRSTHDKSREVVR
jgi:hypothetical protein